MAITIDLPAREGEAIETIETALAEALVSISDAVSAAAVQFGNYANAAHFWAKVRADTGDVYDLTIGDSTGNATNEWVYAGKVAYYAAQAPTYTVKYRTFSLTTGWGSWSTVQTGTGSNTIYCSNASVAGSRTDSFLGDVELLLFAGGMTYDNIDISLGQNYATAPVISIDEAFNRLAIFVAQIKKYQPQAGVFLLLPSTDKASAASIQKTKNVVAGLLLCAAHLGCGVVDVYSAYLALGNADYLYVDTIHPSADGTAIYTQQWRLAHAVPDGYVVAGQAPQPSPLLVSRDLLVDNCDFGEWPDGQSAPTGWTFSNCTVEKDADKAGFGKYAVKVTITAANASISRSLTPILDELQGKSVVTCLDAWIPAGVAKLAGRISLTSSNGVTSSSDLTNDKGVGEGEDYWCPTTSRLRIQSDATSASVSAYLGASNADDVGKVLWLRSFTVAEGLLPAPVRDQTQPDGVIEDASGIVSQIALPLRQAANVDGSAAAAGAGQMSVVMSGGTPPTAIYLKGELAQGNTKTDSAWWEFVVPADYRSGQSLTLSVNAEVVKGSGVLGTATLTPYALPRASDGTIGSDLIAASKSIGVTNLLLYSQDFSNAAWTKANLTFTGSVSDPLGGSNAQKIEVTTTAGTTLYQAATVSDTHAAGSIYVKKGSGTSDGGSFVLRDVTSSTDILGVSLNYDAGTVSYSTGSSGATVEDAGSGWWRLKLITSITSGHSIRFYTGFAGSSQAAGKYFYAIGAQLQANDVVGVYVPTTSAAATSVAAADYNFTITGTALEAGDILTIGVKTIMQETGGSNSLYGRVNSVRVA